MSPQGGLRAKGDMKRQGEGGYPKNQRFGETSFMDGPCIKMTKMLKLLLTIMQMAALKFTKKEKSYFGAFCCSIRKFDEKFHVQNTYQMK